MPLRPRVVALLAPLLGIALLVGGPTPARATTTDGASGGADAIDQPSRTVFARSSYLCYGYRACAQAGMGNAGYAAVNDRMYWRMYAGHNCTNYAAYRMVKSGLPNVRPWSGGGNAEYWGTSVPDLTNGTPAVGAVAWWRANAGPAGSSGHVAYVERVVSSDQIIVSQDSWGGDFSWASITRGSGNWPSGFIHFNDVTMVNVTAPTISGVAKVGSTLRATAGTWKPSDPTVTYQWFAGGAALADATSSTLRLTRARIGQRVKVRVTATKPGYPTRSATSAPTEAVLPGRITNTVAPQIAGEPRVDSTLTLSTGSWSPSASLAVKWLADGRPLEATGTTLAVTPGLVGRSISATVTASRAGYEPVTVTAPATEPVAPGTFTSVAPPIISGTTRPGEVLTIDPGTFQPADATVAIQWRRGGVPVEGAVGTTYRLTSADLGQHISARVVLTRPGYTPLTTRPQRTPRVRALPRMPLDVTTGTGTLRVGITVTAPGVPEVPGTVVARIAGRVVPLSLRHGAAVLRLTGLPRGERTLRLRYLATESVSHLVKIRTVRIG